MPSIRQRRCPKTPPGCRAAMDDGQGKPRGEFSVREKPMDPDDPKQKILALDVLAARVKGLQAAGRLVVFTNGCFDILHAGHVDYLYRARREGDALIVGLNSDRSVRAIKDSGRPIVGEIERATVLAGLGCVDFVTLFDEPDPYRLIVALRPDVLVKGADWQLEQIVGAREVTGWGGRVQRVPFSYTVSTSEIIRRIVARYAGHPRPVDR